MAEKLNEIYTLRVSENLKALTDKLSPEWKIKLNQEIRLTMAKVVHESRFDPSLYLGEDNDA